MQEDLNKVEAVLFTTGRFMNTEEISKATGIASVGYVKELIQKLKEDYEKKDSSLSILELDGKFKLNIKKEYGYITNRLISSSEFDNPTTKTLAVIAYKQPVFQAEVIKIRGNKAYDHIHNLLESGLVTSDKSGRTRILKVTQRFYDYFDTAENKVKEEFNKIKEAIEKKQDIKESEVNEENKAEEQKLN